MGNIPGGSSTFGQPAVGGNDAWLQNLLSMITARMQEQQGGAPLGSQPPLFSGAPMPPVGGPPPSVPNNMAGLGTAGPPPGAGAPGAAPKDMNALHEAMRIPRATAPAGMPERATRSEGMPRVQSPFIQ